MPLLDHFHPPLAGRRHWESFHVQWAGAIANALNLSLPEDYFAETQVHAWPRIEVDVGTFNEPTDSGGGIATLPQLAARLSVPDLTLPATFPPEFGVQIYHASGGPTLVAAVDLVSPGNKDRDDTRRAFAAKCATYILRAIGLIVVDIVTDRHSRPFDEIMTLVYPGQSLPVSDALTASLFRPVRVNGADSLEVRVRSLGVGEVLPELPLALGGLGHVLVNLESTYEEARERSRL